MVMVQSGSVPAQADLAFHPRTGVLEVGGAPVRSGLVSPVRLARTISDCDPSLIGLDPGADRLANSHDLLNCLAMVDRGEPVGRAVFWIRDTGFQVKTDDRKVQLTVRIPTL
jgi:hypothetical protein